MLACPITALPCARCRAPIAAGGLMAEVVGALGASGRFDVLCDRCFRPKRSLMRRVWYAARRVAVQLMGGRA
jgi:hypothetical protein